MRRWGSKRIKRVWRPRRVELEGAEGDARDWLKPRGPLRPVPSFLLHNLNNSNTTTVRAHLGTLYNGMGIPLPTGSLFPQRLSCYQTPLGSSVNVFRSGWTRKIRVREAQLFEVPELCALKLALKPILVSCQDFGCRVSASGRVCGRRVFSPRE